MSRLVTRRVILRDASSRDEISEFALRRGLSEVRTEWVDPRAELQRKTTFSGASDLELWYIEDALADCRYVQASSANLASAVELLRGVESEIHPLSRADLIRAVDDANDPVSLGVALMRLGASAPVEFDEEIQEVISGQFYSEYDVVRDMAVWAATYAPYGKYRPDLEGLCENDESEKIRNRARAVLPICTRIEGGAG